MIFHMRKGANRIMAEYAAITLQRRGHTVYVKNGDGKFILAVIGEGSVSVDGIVGVGKMETSDELFSSMRQQFVDAKEFFRD